MAAESCIKIFHLLLRRVIPAGLFFLIGCTCNTPPSQIEGKNSDTDGQKLITRGKVIYNTSCIACHNSDPKLPGTIGPEIYGSSLELVEARVLKAAYPEGYKAKRQSAAMPAMPYLKEDIIALHAFLNAAPP